MSRYALPLVVLLIACGAKDRDNDGFTSDIDCDDSNPQIHPGADELCDGEVDENCDGLVDDGSAIDAVDWYVDADLDGFGDDAQALRACVRPEGVAPTGGDCDDADPRFRPGAPELCTDPADYDCDGVLSFADVDGDGVPACEDCNDEDPTERPGALWFPDVDGDGYGFPAPVSSCARPEGHVADPWDCDDTDAAINPTTRWWPDADGDGFGATVDPIVGCAPAGDLARQSGDCNDEEPSLHPETVWYEDADGDGFGTEEVWIQRCAPPSGYSLDAGDCDDTLWWLSPRTPWFRDADGDGEGDVRQVLRACEPEPGWVLSNIDCDDTDATRNSTTPWYADADGDGVGSSVTVVRVCEAPAGFVAVDGDCDDADDTVLPGAVEQCDEVDHDCDGSDGLADCEDCDALLAADPTTPDGIYTIDPDGAGGVDAFEAFCDMTTDGGGWTRFWWYDAGSGFRRVKDVLGGGLDGCDSRRDARCFASLPVAAPDELLVVDDGGVWGVWAFDSDNATSTRVLSALVSAAPEDGACGEDWAPVATASTAVSEVCGEDGCGCFAYESRGGTWSVHLGGSLGTEGTVFSAGGDGDGGMGVDALDASSRGNIAKRGLELYWR